MLVLLGTKKTVHTVPEKGFLRMKISEIANPLQVVLVTSRYKEKDNILTLAWHMPVSFDPPLYAISAGKTRFSTSLIQKSKCFVVNFVPFELKDKVLFCGTNSGKNMDKFKESNLLKEKSEKIDCPRIKEASGFLECKVINEIDAGDHIIFIAEVVNSGLKKKTGRIYHLQGGDFATIK